MDSEVIVKDSTTIESKTNLKNNNTVSKDANFTTNTNNSNSTDGSVNNLNNNSTNITNNGVNNNPSLNNQNSSLTDNSAGVNSSYGQSPLSNGLAGPSHDDKRSGLNSPTNTGLNSTPSSSFNGPNSGSGLSDGLNKNSSLGGNPSLNPKNPLNKTDNLDGGKSNGNPGLGAGKSGTGSPSNAGKTGGVPAISGKPGGGFGPGGVPLSGDPRDAAKMAGRAAAKAALASATGGATEIPVVNKLIDAGVGKAVDKAVDRVADMAENIPGSPLNKEKKSSPEQSQDTIEKLTGLNPQQQKILLVGFILFFVFVFGSFTVIVNLLVENKLGILDLANDVINNDEANQVLNELNESDDSLNEVDLDAYYISDDIIEVKLVAHQYNLNDLKDMFNSNNTCDKDNNCANDVSRRFYLKLYDLYYLYKSKYNVNLDLSLLISTLIYNSDDYENTFYLNLSDYERESIVEQDWKPSETTSLDWDYDYESKPNYLVENDSSMDMQILAKNMVAKVTTEKCINGDNQVVTTQDVKDYEPDLICDEGETLEKGSSKYILDLDKYKKFLPEYIEKKWYLGRRVSNPVRSSGPNYYSNKKPSVLNRRNNSSSNNGNQSGISVSGIEAIDKLTSIALGEVGNGGGKYRTFLWGSNNGLNWCAAFISWLFDQVSNGENKFIVSSGVAGGIPSQSISNNLNGQWLEDECTDSSTVPRAGDLVLYDPCKLDGSGNCTGVYMQYPNNGGNSRYYSSHIGYVYDVDDTYIYTVEGNSGGGDGVVSKKQIARNRCGSSSFQGINGYYRPDYNISSSENSTSSSSGNSSATLVSSGGFKGDIYYYCQYDYTDPYGYGGYGSIAANGCGPTSLAIAISSLLQEKHDPIELTNYLCGINGCTPSDGSIYWKVYEAAQNYGEKYGFTATPTSDLDLIKKKLSEGNSLVVTITNGGFYTNDGVRISSGGHYFVLTGVADGDNVYITDPANPNNTGRTISLSGLAANSNNRPDAPSFCILTR